MEIEEELGLGFGEVDDCLSCIQIRCVDCKYHAACRGEEDGDR